MSIFYRIIKEQAETYSIKKKVKNLNKALILYNLP